MRPDVDRMEREVDRLWYRLLWGYTAFGACTLLSLMAGMWSGIDWLTPAGIAIGLAALIPWGLQSVRVSRAIKEADANTRAILAALGRAADTGEPS